jgi:hypothetical protein
MNIKFCKNLFLPSILLLLCNSLVGQDISEIVVTEDRTLSVIENDILQATFDIYDIYNELNEDDEYDVHCYSEIISGSRIKQQFCQANYEVRAQSDSSSDYFRGQQGGNPQGSQVSAAALTGSETAVKKKILGEKMLGFANNNKSLADAMLKLQGLQEEYLSASE